MNHFYHFCPLRDMSKCKQSVSVITGDFSAKSLSWWSEDINTSEGTKLNLLPSLNGFWQFINDPTHIQTNSLSCIDLVFTEQSNLSVNCGFHASLHFHHETVHIIFNLNISYPHHNSVLYGITQRQIQKKIGKPKIR